MFFSGGRRRKTIRCFVIGTLAALIICALLERDRVKNGMREFLGWVEVNQTWGLIVFVLIYALATVLFIPGAILTVGAGFTFGKIFGVGKGVALSSVAVFIGATMGSIAAFLLGRYLFRDFVAGLIEKYPTFDAIDRALQGNGLLIMILLRLSPLIPYNALDYLLGCTQIPLWSYSLALVAVLPGVFMYTFIGASASSLTNSEHVENPTLRILSLIFGIVFAVLGVGVASYFANRELNQIISNNETTSGDMNSDASTSSMIHSEITEGMLIV